MNTQTATNFNYIHMEANKAIPYIEQLRLSRTEAPVAFQEFALSTREHSTHLFCFFEGKDNAYYVPRIKRFTELYHPIKCGGKESVLKLHALLANRPEYNPYKKAFFIDRDFNAPIEPVSPPIFETPCYSIENFYTSMGVFKEILTNEFHLSDVSDKAIFDACFTLFEQQQRAFHAAICLFNAWYACLIGIRETTREKIEDAKLGDRIIFKGKDGAEGGKKYFNYIDITLQSVTVHYDLDTIKQTFPNAIVISEEVLEQKYQQFQACDSNKIFRGKFEMQFLIKFIQLLLTDSFTNKTVLKNKVNFSFGDGSGLNNSQALNIFEGYAETPKSLLDYLAYVTQ